jgi:hypothetical protein
MNTLINTYVTTLRDRLASLGKDPALALLNSREKNSLSQR